MIPVARYNTSEQAAQSAVLRTAEDPAHTYTAQHDPITDTYVVLKSAD